MLLAMGAGLRTRAQDYQAAPGAATLRRPENSVPAYLPVKYHRSATYAGAGLLIGCVVVVAGGIGILAFAQSGDMFVRFGDEVMGGC